MTKVVPQPTPDSYSNYRATRSGEPSDEDKEAAKANGPSEKEEKAEADAKKDDAANAAKAKEAEVPEAPEAPSLIQIRSKADPSLADQQEADYQKVYDTE